MRTVERVEIGKSGDKENSTGTGGTGKSGLRKSKD